MIQRFTEDDDGNTSIEFDLEGIDYLIDGLQELRASPVDTVLATPALWTNDDGDPVVGEIRLRRVA